MFLLFVFFLYEIHAVTLNPIMTATECEGLRSTTKDTSLLPCECRRSDPTVATACHPRCCPKSSVYTGDRCHAENTVLWSPYEQIVCRPPTTTQNFLNDGVCWRTYGSPNNVQATRISGGLRVTFLLSLLEQHRCVDLFIAPCKSQRGALSDVLLRKSTGDCWMPCPSYPILPCTSSSCSVNRGQTSPYVREWQNVPDLPTGNYALVCQSVSKISTTSSNQAEVNQTQFSATPFYIP
eukprot:PhF_6_TR19132/c0_g1_i2/m.28144